MLKIWDQGHFVYSHVEVVYLKNTNFHQHKNWLNEHQKLPKKSLFREYKGEKKWKLLWKSKNVEISKSSEASIKLNKKNHTDLGIFHSLPSEPTDWNFVQNNFNSKKYITYQKIYQIEGFSFFFFSKQFLLMMFTIWNIIITKVQVQDIGR